MPEPLTVAIPGLIDGDPEEVEDRILQDIPRTIDALADYIDGVCKQLANTERSRILAERGGTIPAAELQQVYAASPRAAQIARLLGAAKALAAVAAELPR